MQRWKLFVGLEVPTIGPQTASHISRERRLADVWIARTLYNDWHCVNRLISSEPVMIQQSFMKLVISSVPTDLNSFCISKLIICHKRITSCTHQLCCYLLILVMCKYLKAYLKSDTEHGPEGTLNPEPYLPHWIGQSDLLTFMLQTCN
jgi:hypothetical protein